MAINPPRSNVQLMNPAALLANNQRQQQEPMDFMSVILQRRQQQFQAEQNALARQQREGEALANLILSGEAVQAGDERLRGLPSDLTTFDYAGQTLVPTSEIQAAQYQEWLRQPAAGQGGIEYLQGTTNADIAGSPAGFNIAGQTASVQTGGQAAGSRDQFIEGNKEVALANLQAALDIVQQSPSMSARAGELTSMMEAIRDDKQFSLAEQKQYQITQEQMNALADDLLSYEQFSADQMARLGEAREESYSIQVIELSSNEAREPAPYEREVIVKNNLGQQLSPEEQSVLDGLEIVPKQTALNRASLMLDQSTRASVDDHAITTAARSIELAITTTDEDGNSIYNLQDPLYKMIQGDLDRGQINDTAIRQWLRSSSSNAIDYRNALALRQVVSPQISEIEKYLRRGGEIPFDAKGATNPIFKLFTGTWTPSGNMRARNMSDARTSSALPLNAEEAAEVGTLVSDIREALPGLSDGAYDLIINGNADSYRRNVEEYRRFQSGPFSEYEKARMEATANVFEILERLPRPVLQEFKQQLGGPSN